jgi:uracil-DNA glycosylase family 4
LTEFSLEDLNARIVACRRCPRLVEWRERVAIEKRRSFADEPYWGRPVPCFGDPLATHLIVGLAPAAHGANRTGRMFTGDRSGDWLYRALFKAGVASQASSTSDGDGLVLTGVMIAATCHCAPPDNKPLPEEIAQCSGYLVELLGSRPWAGVLCLGGIAWNHVHRLLGDRPPKFAHGVVSVLSTRIVGSYHPSQQNTFTGRLTEPMLDEVIGEWLGVRS